MKLIGYNDTVKHPVLITYASLAHFMYALSFAWIIYPLLDKKNSFVKGLIVYNVLHLLYELKDYMISYNKNVSDYLKKVTDNPELIQWSTENSFENSVADTVVANLGYILGYYLSFKMGNILGKIIGIILLFTTIIFSILYSTKLD